MTVFGGIHCVLYALFDAAGRLDRAAMGQQVEWVLEAGVDGVTVLGLATEVGKLTLSEQQDVIAWATADIAGRVPLSVTVTGNSVAEQRKMVSIAQGAGAAWIILQPPSIEPYGPATYVDFFDAVAKGFNIPFSIQNAPAYLGRTLMAEDIATLFTRNPAFQLIKSETSAVDIAALITRCGPAMTVLNGRGGLEMTDCLRAGAQGFVLAPDAVDQTKRIFDLWQAGASAEAEQAYAEVLPAITFMMQSIEHLICYGKRVFAHRAGVIVHDRQPALAPTQFGLESVRYWADQLEAIRNKNRTSAMTLPPVMPP